MDHSNCIGVKREEVGALSVGDNAPSDMGPGCGCGSGCGRGRGEGAQERGSNKSGMQRGCNKVRSAQLTW